jgi:hypothetical protein
MYKIILYYDSTYCVPIEIVLGTLLTRQQGFELHYCTVRVFRSLYFYMINFRHLMKTYIVDDKKDFFFLFRT